MTNIVVQERILEDLYKILDSGMIHVKGGMKDILDLLENAKKETGRIRINLMGEPNVWDKIAGICHSRNRNDYTAAGLRNFFSRSHLFGSGRDPMAALIYHAIDDISENEVESGNRINNLAGLLNTHQKRRAWFRLKKEIIIKETPNQLIVLCSSDIGLLDAIKQSLTNPDQPLYPVMQNNRDISIYICADPPKKTYEFPKKKSIILSRIKNDYYAYFIEESTGKEIVVGKKLKQEEIPRQMKIKYFELELKKLKEDRMGKNARMTGNVFLNLDLTPSEENVKKYKNILKKCYPDIHHGKPATYKVSGILSQNFVFQQVASYARKLYGILNHCGLIATPEKKNSFHSKVSHQNTRALKRR